MNESSDNEADIGTESDLRGMDGIIASLPQFRKISSEMSELLLANLVMIGEVPSPTFGEDNRMALLGDRFAMAGLDNCSTDEVGNVAGILPGVEGEGNILLVAHLDTVFPENIDHAVHIQPERVRGVGLGDNSLGLAALATMPHLLEKLGIKLKNNLILMGGSHSMGPGNLEGLHFFLKNFKYPIKAGICVEGAPLGRLSYSSIGMLRGEIHCSVPDEYDWTRFGVMGAIQILNEVINRITEIPLPRRPRTSIVLGSIRGGNSFDVIATQAVLRFEIRSESAQAVQDIRNRIDMIIEEVSAFTNANAVLKVFAVRSPGGLAFNNPMIQNTRQIMKSLRINPRMIPSTSELTAFIEQNIPAITLGITKADKLNEIDEKLQIKPMFRGMAQIIGVLLAIDGGLCDES